MLHPDARVHTELLLLHCYVFAFVVLLSLFFASPLLLLKAWGA